MNYSESFKDHLTDPVVPVHYIPCHMARTNHAMLYMCS